MPAAAPPATSSERPHQPSLRIDGAQARPTTLASLIALTKPRLSLLSVATTVIGYLATVAQVDGPMLLALIVGTAMSAGGALALNQWWERGTDCIMERTRDRPLPAGHLSPGTALAFGLALAGAGVLSLWAIHGAAAAGLSAATILSYVFVYTPLKSRSRWATEVGGISGALPPLIGWQAAGGSDPLLGASLFGILFFWQMPHFFAIGWVYREEYRSAALPMLSTLDASGRRTATWSVAYTVATVAVSLLPAVSGRAGWVYAAVAGVLGVIFLARAGAFLSSGNRDAAARSLFRWSLAYLPLLLAALVADRRLG